MIAVLGWMAGSVSRRRSWRRATVLGVLAALAATLLTPAPAFALTDLPQHTVSFNGPVRAIVYSGGRVYVGGDFTAVYRDGRRTYRSHLAALDADTGALLPFAPALNGPVHSLAAGGGALYAGGTFTQVGTQPHRHIARFTGDSVDASFRHSVSGLPRALVVGKGRLYIGGSFSTVDGEARANVAAIDLDDNTLDAFAPAVVGAVYSLALGTYRLYIGGKFNDINGSGIRKLGAVSNSTGTVDTGFRPGLLVIAYKVLLAHGRVYAALGGQGGRLRAMDYTGKPAWETTSDGDVQAVTAIGDTLYAGGHFESVCNSDRTGDQGVCLDGTKARRGKLFAVTSGGTLTAWDPDADSAVGVITMATDGEAVAAGGEFLTFANGTVAQRGFAQFRD